MGIRSASPALVLAASCLAALALAAPAAAAVPKAPPRPVLVADGGAHVRAARGSYCWRGIDSFLCVDTTDPISFAPRLVAAAGSTLTVRMGYPVRGVRGSIGDDSVDLRPLGDRRRKYELTLPDSPLGGRADLRLSARYDRGDGSFAVRIRPR